MYHIAMQRQPTFNDNFMNLDHWIVSNWGNYSNDYVDLSTGMLRLRVMQDGITSAGGEVQCRQLFGYGIYEWTMRASSTSDTPFGFGHVTSGQITALFNFVNNSQTEIDAVEIEGNHPNRLQFTNHRMIGFKQHTPIEMPVAPHQAFHRYIPFSVEDAKNHLHS